MSFCCLVHQFQIAFIQFLKINNFFQTTSFSKTKFEKIHASRNLERI